MPPPTPTYEDRRPAAMGGMYRSKRGVSQAAGNRSYLDELYFRNAGLSSSEARQAAIDLMRSGFNVLPSGEATPGDLFARSSRMQRTSTPAAGQPPSAVPDDTVTPSEQGALASITGLNPDDLRAMASVQPTMRERFSTVATEEPTAQLGETVITGSRPAQGMPPTIRDALSHRVDTIGPAGAPTRISSLYGTATRQDFALSPSERLKAEAGKYVRPASMPRATVKDSDAYHLHYKPVPLLEYLRQRGAHKSSPVSLREYMRRREEALHGNWATWKGAT